MEQRLNALVAKAPAFDRVVQEAPMCAAWTLRCPEPHMHQILSFTAFGTTPEKTEVKIYEGGDGPMHGTFSGVARPVFLAPCDVMLISCPGC